MSGSSTRRRAGKRARVEEPAAPASSSPPAAAAPTIDTLPDAVMSDVFKVLGPRASWPLRGVCRRWRRILEETEWASIDIDIDLNTENASYFCTALPERKLRLSDGASVRFRSRLENVWFDGVHQNNQFRVTAALRLLVAIGSSRSGRAQPRRVSVEFDGEGEAFIDHYPSANADVVASFSSYLLGVLWALAPQDGAASGLESLSVGFQWRRSPCDPEGDEEPELADVLDKLPAGEAPWPAGPDLQAGLAPFRGLLSLALVFDDVLMGVSREAATVIAATCPLLRSVSVSLRPFRESSNGVLAALARLAHLEELVLEWPDGDVCPRSHAFDAEAGLTALADGPAGQSLRRVAARSLQTIAAASTAPPLAPVAFPTRYEDCDFEPIALSDGVLCALGRMPRLEYVEGLRIRADEAGRAAAVALGRLAGLREARLVFRADSEGQAQASAALRALAETVAALPRLEVLGMSLSAGISSTGSDAIVEFLASAGVRRALTGVRVAFRMHDLARAREFAAALSGLPRLARLSLYLSGPPDPDAAALIGSAHVAAAILALPALERLELFLALYGSAPAETPVPLHPFEVLRHGLRPEVELVARLFLPLGPGCEAAKEAVRGLFAGRPSSWVI
eukprot:tig00001177_g7374.t1